MPENHRQEVAFKVKYRIATKSFDEAIIHLLVEGTMIDRLVKNGEAESSKVLVIVRYGEFVHPGGRHTFAAVVLLVVLTNESIFEEKVWPRKEYLSISM
jgi:hypothetical protein